MGYVAGHAMEARLRVFLGQKIGLHLPRKAHRESFALYAFGIVGEGDRKSVEPIAARATGDARACENTLWRVLNFLRVSKWSDADVRLAAARYVVDALQKQEPVTTWSVDDTGFPKQGQHSVGVQRQYTGTLGKIGNCQIGVSLTVATQNEHVPIDFALYMPQSWCSNAAKRRQTRVPAELTFKTKPELAIEMIERAVKNGIPGKVVLADSGYGNSSTFRNAVRALDLDIGVAVQASTKVWLLNGQGHRKDDAQCIADISCASPHNAFRKYTWRSGAGGELSSQFSFHSVKVAHDDGSDAGDREPLWLVMEWLDGDEKPTKFFLTSLPRRMAKKEIVRILKERWRTERAYQELKGELGLDHFEGRSYTGWHHHISVVLCCYAFIVAERVQHFSPSEARKSKADTLTRAA